METGKNFHTFILMTQIMATSNFIYIKFYTLTKAFILFLWQNIKQSFDNEAKD